MGEALASEDVEPPDSYSLSRQMAAATMGCEIQEYAMGMEQLEGAECEALEDLEGQKTAFPEEEETFSQDNHVVIGSDGRQDGYSIKRCDTDLQFANRLQPHHKERQQYSRWQIAVLAFQTLGVVYGDIGTSPLYVYASTKLEDPGRDDFLGAMCIMFWTLTMIPLLKYVFIVLRADDHGEGGSFAIYSKLCQAVKIGQTAGRQYTPLDSDAHLTYHSDVVGSSGSVHAMARNFIEKSRVAQKMLLGLVCLGTSMIMGDGVLTPAISVISSVEGLKGLNVPHFWIVVTAAVILLLLFMLQRFGTSRVAVLFSPIMVAWFLCNPVIGVYNICRCYPSVIRAVWPGYGVLFFQRNGVNGWRVLSGLVLVITGSEAMFWDLGHFNQKAIKLGFTCLVYPSLILTYCGQTAFLIKHPGSIDNAFYDSIPKAVYWPVFGLAALAAVVASQALISATFCVFKQAIALGCLPRMEIKHTSEKEEGQIYCPAANYMLMILCLAMVCGFQSSGKIANAYGVAVLFDLLITTSLVSIVMLLVWNTAWPLILAFFITFSCIETAYLSSVMVKFAHGGWVPFGIAAAFLGVMGVWNYGRGEKHAYEVQHRISAENLRGLLTGPSGITRVPGICFFYSELQEGPPPVFTHYVQNVRSLHRILVFTTIRFIPVKSVISSERYLVGKVGYGPGVYRCVARYGYKDLVDVAEKGFMLQVIECLQNYLETHEVDTDGSSAGEELRELQTAANSGAIYVKGISRLEVPKASCSGWFKRFVINKLYYLLQHNCRSGIEDLQVPHANLVEVRMVYDW